MIFTSSERLEYVGRTINARIDRTVVEANLQTNLDWTERQKSCGNGNALERDAPSKATIITIIMIIRNILKNMMNGHESHDVIFIYYVI